MNDREFKEFEAELHTLQPAAPPPEFLARLAAAVTPPAHPAPRRPRRPASPWLSFAPWLRWLAPAGAAAVVAFLIWRGPRPAPTPEVAQTPLPPPASSALQPDDVQIARRFVGTFDALAELPSGETVRFRCLEWTDQTTLRDAARGIEVVQSTPSFEVVPIGFETY